MKKRVLTLLLAGIMAVSTTGVSSFAAETETETATETASKADEDYGEVVIEDGDRTITFTEMPKGILCLYSGEVLMKLGLKDYIVATNEKNKGRKSPMEGVAEDFDGIPELEKSQENAVASGADLIVGEISAFKDTNWGTFESLEDKGINCYALNGTVVADETMDSIYQDIENMGKIFKVEDKAEALIEDTKAQISEIQDAVKDVKEEDKVKAFVMDSLSGNEIYTTSAGLESNLIELAGGINTTKGMSDSRWFTTSVETLVTANPDVIIFNDYGVEGQVQENMDFITNNAALADVPAVKNQNYVVVPLAYVMHDLSAVPTVPTGIKIGVSICPWSVVISPARALVLLSVYCNSNVIPLSFRSFLSLRTSRWHRLLFHQSAQWQTLP